MTDEFRTPCKVSNQMSAHSDDNGCGRGQDMDMDTELSLSLFVGCKCTRRDYNRKCPHRHDKNRYPWGQGLWNASF